MHSAVVRRGANNITSARSMSSSACSTRIHLRRKITTTHRHLKIGRALVRRTAMSSHLRHSCINIHLRHSNISSVRSSHIRGNILPRRLPYINPFLLRG